MKVVFDKSSPNWTKDFESNIIYVRYAEDYFNDLLKVRGYVTILEIIGYLGLIHDLEDFMSKQLKDLCWVYKDDDAIDFRMDPDKDKNIIYLDFNIDID